MAYERKFGKWLKEQTNEPIYIGQWIWFEDSNGFGYAQPDAFILEPARIILCECKLSYRDSAWRQLRDLYAPLLQSLFSRPVTCIQVTRYVEEGSTVVTSWPAPDGSVFFWLGN